jgi:putative membrane protein
MGHRAVHRVRVLATLAALAAAPALAHEPSSSGSASWPWAFEPWIVALLGLSVAMYGVGVRRLWRRAGAGRGITVRQAICFAAGWMVLAAALTSPLDALGAALFSMHMVQHELLMVVAAPLFVLSRPLEAWTWALPSGWRRPLASIGRLRPLAALWTALTEPLGAWMLHAVVLWAWHIPWLFAAALAYETVHALQHGSFLAAALAFWWSVLGRGVRRPDAAGVASLFTTMLHTGALGALLTFAPHPWYAHYAGTAAAFGLTALEDQQLGGLVMWVPGGLAYMVAGLVIVAAWLAPERSTDPAR